LRGNIHAGVGTSSQPCATLLNNSKMTEEMLRTVSVPGQRAGWFMENAA
jgi:hypothetical protein